LLRKVQGEGFGRGDKEGLHEENPQQEERESQSTGSRLRHRVVGKAEASKQLYASKALKIREALVPPKPNELDMAAFTLAFLAVLGTKSRSHSGSGVS